MPARSDDVVSIRRGRQFLLRPWNPADTAVMHQTFTGSSRRPRQVNLSGRNPNPFAALPSSRPSGPQAVSQPTVAVAQQERLQRQQERDRLNKTKVLQRTWRGYRSRKNTKHSWRQEWDELEQKRQGEVLDFGHAQRNLLPTLAAPKRYDSTKTCWAQLRLLLQFITVKDKTDTLRLVYFGEALRETLEDIPSMVTGEQWSTNLSRLGTVTLSHLESFESPSIRNSTIENLLDLLLFLAKLVPRQIASKAACYYSAVARITKTHTTDGTPNDVVGSLLVQNALALLRPVSAQTLSTYEAFALDYLTVPDLPAHLGGIDELVNGINYKLLASALVCQSEGDSLMKGRVARSHEDGLWLLAYFIYIHRQALGSGEDAKVVPDPDFVQVVSLLLISLSNDIATRSDLEDTPMRSGTPVTADVPPVLAPLAPFIRREILTLVNEDSISGLLSQAGTRTSNFWEKSSKGRSADAEGAKVLATYALTLLQVFPSRGNDIRMWLYVGSTSSPTPVNNKSRSRLAAIKYFWQAARSTSIFREISKDSRSALSLLKPLPTDSSRTLASRQEKQEDRDQEWRIILLFLELYTSVLKVMDDQEFLNGGASTVLPQAQQKISWTRESALPLEEVKDLTLFLKNLAFTLYWNASDLADTQPHDDHDGIKNYFTTSGGPPMAASNRTIQKDQADSSIAGLLGLSSKYLKGIVTGLLRMVHERDSRRRFLPEGHWLMTRRFDMEGFIPAVVAEEENRHRIQEDDEEDLQDDDFEEDTAASALIGTARVQQTRQLAVLRKRQEQATRRRQIEAVAPRLEILRNLPFFIPFTTRVQIFREFVYRDQKRRRNGFVDPDTWRMSVMRDSRAHMDSQGRVELPDAIRRHHANIRRESVFEDAYEQYYDLGEDLKEPIQISFIDKFDTVEAGIDGGGVTKEFLTSVTNEAFNPENGLNLFVENDQNLLYPNPSSVEQRKEILRQAIVREGSAEWNEHVRELLRRYEFLGRIIGKCLYEGILVDVNFAGFFLLKWALTGGTTAASRESAYRANLNDLRDLDEGLYQGLVSARSLLLVLQLLTFPAVAAQELSWRRRGFFAQLHRD